MDKYLKLMTIKGLIQSLDEQLFIRFQKNGLEEAEKKLIVDKYFDAINEQLELPDPTNEEK